MGTVQAIACSVKSYGRAMAAACYAAMPGFLSGLKGKVSILTYHRVLSHSELSTQYVQPGMYVSVDVFDRQLQFLKRHCTVLSFADLLAMWATRQWDITQRYCVVTFDDGWLDNYRHAFPLLKRYGIPATIFLPTDYIGTDQWFWPDRISWLWPRWNKQSGAEQHRVWSAVSTQHAWCQGLEQALMGGDIESLLEGCKPHSYDRIDHFVQSWADALGVLLPSERQVMNWDEVNEMSQSGIFFGSHSMTHKILTTVSDEELLQEVQGSWDALRRRVVRALPVFCYPNGNWNERIGRAVEVAGYEAAVTTEFGYETGVPGNLYALKRINMHEAVTCSDALLGFHLAGWNHRHG